MANLSEMGWCLWTSVRRLQNLMKGGLAKHVCFPGSIFNDTVRKLLVGVVDVYRQPSQEVRQTKNRLML